MVPMDRPRTLELEPRQIIPALVRNDDPMAGGIEEYLLDVHKLVIRHRYELSHPDLLSLRRTAQGRLDYFHARVLSDLLSADVASVPDRVVALPHVAKSQLHGLLSDFLDTDWHPNLETRERAKQAYDENKSGSGVMRVLQRDPGDSSMFSRKLLKYQWKWLGDFVRNALVPFNVSWSTAPEDVAAGVITRNENVIGQMIEDEWHALQPDLAQYLKRHLSVGQQRLGVVTGFIRGMRSTRRVVIPERVEIDLGGQVVVASLSDLRGVAEKPDTSLGVGDTVFLEVAGINDETVDLKLLAVGPWLEIDRLYPRGTIVKVVQWWHYGGDWLSWTIEEGVPARISATELVGIQPGDPFYAEVVAIDHEQRTIILKRYRRRPRETAARATQ